MTSRYEWRLVYEQEIADLHRGIYDAPRSVCYLLSEANACAMIGQITEALCIYLDFLAAARNTKLQRYVPAVEKQIALLYKYRTSLQYTALDRHELLIHLEQLEQQAPCETFRGIRQTLGFPDS